MPPGLSPGPVVHEDLLDRIRNQWRQGDWSALAATPLQEIEHHASRALLALLLAAGHQQVGQLDGARRCAQQALAWGCDRKSVAQVLISGVHSSLARAAALNDDAVRGRQHLEAALGLAYPGQDVRDLLAQRERQLLHPLSNRQGPSTMAPLDDDEAPDGVPAPPAAASSQAPLPPGAYTQIQRVLNLLRKTSTELQALRLQVDQIVPRQAQQLSRWTEDYLRIARRLDRQPELPSFQGWAISADLGVWLMDRVEAGLYDAILEFGSGSSTLLLAMATMRFASVRPSGPPAPRHLALEHLQEHLIKTQALLDRHAPGHAVQLHRAPLVAMARDDGSETPFYDAGPVIAAWASELVRAPRLLVLVDGPPASAGPLSRAPALDTLLQHFPRADVDCVIDDYARADEQAMAQRWLARLTAAGRTPRLESLGFVKDAALLQWSAAA